MRSNLGRRFEALEDRRMLAAFELSTLISENGGDGTAGFVAEEPSSEDGGLWEISTRGDVNGDGFDDLVVSAPFVNAYIDPEITTGPKKDRTTDRREGVVYVVFGDAQGIPAEIDLTSLDGVNGLTIYAPDDAHTSATGLAVGDINGDGIDDIAFTGEPVGVIDGVTQNPDGVFTVFGRADWGVSGASPVFESQNVLPSFGGDGSLGFYYDVSPLRTETAWLGAEALSIDGDLNGDGIDDMVVQLFDTWRDGGSDTQVQVIFGSGDFSAYFDSTEISADLVTIWPPSRDPDIASYFGSAIGGGEDLNGDGVDDLVLGSWQGTPNEGADDERWQAGQTFVLFGGEDFVGTIESSSLFTANGGDGSRGFVVNGVSGDPLPDNGSIEGNILGASVYSGGDFNGDGVSDLAISAFRASNSTGEAYVLFGKSAAEPGFPAEIDPSTLDGSNGFVVRGLDVGDRFSENVALGDFNGDGFADLIAAAGEGDPDGREDAGEVYVVYGGPGVGSQGEVDLAAIINGYGVDGLVVNGVEPGDRTGDIGAATLRRLDVGDINGDGIADLSFGTDLPSSTPNLVYTIYGGPNILPPPPAPSFSINDVVVTEGDSGTVTATFTVNRAGDSSGTDTVGFSTADDTATLADNDYVATFGMLTFDPGVTSLPVEVNINGDTNQEGYETFFVNLSNPSVGASVDDGVGIGMILDDDAPLDVNVIYVWDIQDTLQTRQRGKNFTDYRIVVDVRQDSDADGVAEITDAVIAGVAVTVELRNSGGTLIGRYSGLTNDQGLFQSEWIKDLTPDDYRAEVTDLALAGFAWDPLDLLDATDNDEDDGDNPYELYAIG